MPYEIIIVIAILLFLAAAIFLMNKLLDRFITFMKAHIKKQPGKIES